MIDVPIPAKRVKQTFDISRLLEMNPIEVSSNVNDLINIVKTTIETYNASSLYVVYFIGKTMNDAVLGKKYPGLTFGKLAQALGISQTKASRYHKIAELLTPEEVYDLRKIPYKWILKFPQIAEQYGEAALKELKFRLITKDFEGVKSGTTAFSEELDAVAKHYLELDSSLPDSEASTKALELATVSEAEVVEVTNPCETAVDTEEDDEGTLAFDKILADRSKAVKEDLSGDGSKSKTETSRKASIGLAQSKRAIQKLRPHMVRLIEDMQPVLEALWQNEDYIIGDPAIDADYRVMMRDFEDDELRMLEALLKFHKEFQKHGYGRRKVEMPEGTTAETLLNPQG